MKTRKLLPILGMAILVSGSSLVIPAATEKEGEKQASGLGLCAKCSLHMTAACQNAVVVTVNGKREVFLLKDNEVSKAFHKVVCKTSQPILVTGKVVKASHVSAAGEVIVGEIVASKLALDDCEINGEVTLAGVGQCAKCALQRSATCQNVIVCHIDGKDIEFWLTDNDASKAFHKTICKTKETILAKGTVVKQPPPQEGEHAEFAASTLTLLRSDGSAAGAVHQTAGGELTLTGVGQCAKCALQRSATCQNVIVCRINDKNVYYWLTDNDASKAFHKTICKTKETIEVTGTVVQEPQPGVGGLFTASSLRLVKP